MTDASVPIVLDTDAGIDDAVALALAARSPELRLVGVTATYGNARLADTGRNARHVLSLAGRPDVPVLPGADRPLVLPPPPPSEKHGGRGMGYAVVPSSGVDSDEGTPTAMLDALSVCPPEPVTTLVTLGPLTNLAHALDRDAATVRARVGRHLAVLGPPGPSAGADFNFAADPDAAVRVLDAGLPTDVVPPTVTRRLVVAGAAVERLRASGDPLVRWLTDALRWYVEVHHRLHDLDGCWVHDALPVAEAVRPGTLAFGSPRPEIGARVARHLEIGTACSLLDRVFGAGWNGSPTGES